MPEESSKAYTSMRCPECGGEIYWQDSYSYEDVGMEGDGTCNCYECSNCGAWIETYISFDDAETNIKE